MNRYRLLAGLGATAALAGICLLLAAAPSGQAARADEAHGEAEEGMRVYKTNCVGCHKWHGEGGGGYGGAAANLRQTQLDYAAILLTITCGRPGTGMPHFQDNAYDDGHCYGLKEADIPPEQKVAAPVKWLRKPDIEVVAHYVQDSLKGKGDPTYAQCQAFFGTSSRVCDVYQHAGEQGASSGRLKVETAPDSNQGAPK